jgi:hypothetical protein
MRGGMKPPPRGRIIYSNETKYRLFFFHEKLTCFPNFINISRRKRYGHTSILQLLLLQ